MTSFKGQQTNLITIEIFIIYKYNYHYYIDNIYWWEGFSITESVDYLGRIEVMVMVTNLTPRIDSHWFFKFSYKTRKQ